MLNKVCFKYVFLESPNRNHSAYTEQNCSKTNTTNSCSEKRRKYSRGKSNVCKYEMTAGFREQCFPLMQGSSIQTDVSKHTCKYHQMDSAGYVYIHICMYIYASMYIYVCTFYACIFVCVHTCMYKDIKKMSWIW